MSMMKMLYSKRFLFMFLVALFYSAAVVYLVELSRLDSTQRLGPELFVSRDDNNLNLLIHKESKQKQSPSNNKNLNQPKPDHETLNQPNPDHETLNQANPDHETLNQAKSDHESLNQTKPDHETLNQPKPDLERFNQPKPDRENLPAVIQTVKNRWPTDNATHAAHIKAMEYADWNDYELMARDNQRQGWGEHGEPFTHILSLEEQELSNKLMEQYNYNAFASDHISLERSTVDLRKGKCKTKLFLKNLPQNSVSVVITVHNEKNSTVLRTIHSVVNRSPASLLREIVLVDDFSSNEELHEQFEDYIGQHLAKVRLVRNPHRMGLITSRMIGANATSGDYLLFLDSHIEVNYNYLPPLLELVVLDYRKIACPLIDVINTMTLEIRSLARKERGAFSWDLVYRLLPLFQNDETVPYNVSVLLGAAFVISRRWWEEIGQYDPELKIWGGEQLEISFKSWLCGGSVVDNPCSRVAHNFRPLPYIHEVTEHNLVERNYHRVARVWMDEYIEYVFQRRPAMQQTDPGDLTERFAIKKRLNCKPFKWYLTEVASDVVKYFPLIEPPRKAWGFLRSKHNDSLCILPRKNRLYMVVCKESNLICYIYDWKNRIRFYYSCFINSDSKNIFMETCRFYDPNATQSFAWDPVGQRIINSHTSLCIDFDIVTLEVYMAGCDDSRTTQLWMFEQFNATLLISR